MNIKVIAFPMLVALSLLFGACAEQTIEAPDAVDGAAQEEVEGIDIEQSAEDAGNAIKEGGKDLQEGLEDGAKTLEKGAGDATEAVQDGVENLEKGAENAGEAIKDLGDKLPGSESE